MLGDLFTVPLKLYLILVFIISFSHFTIMWKRSS